jgi:RecG-like helicase
MKKVLYSSLAAIGMFSFAASTSIAADDDAKEITIKGEGKCGKCALKETDSCQNVVQVDAGKNKGTYYLVQNEVSKSFHDNICKETKNVTATGTVKKVDGKNQFTATKIEVADK